MKRQLSYLLSALAASSAFAENKTVDTRIGKLEFTHDFANGYPTRDTVEKLYDERDFQRACQAYLWAIPAVSFAQWQRGQASFGAGNRSCSATKIGWAFSRPTRPRRITWSSPTCPMGRW